MRDTYTISTLSAGSLHSTSFATRRVRAAPAYHSCIRSPIPLTTG